jgi:hypothetical protein
MEYNIGFLMKKGIYKKNTSLEKFINQVLYQLCWLIECIAMYRDPVNV